jgi:glycosyltransferase involved in cell wall biosynthesis
MTKQTRILAVLPGMCARGAETCTLNLLTGLKAMGYESLYFHAALRQNLPAHMELHLKPRLEEVAHVSYGIHGDTGRLNENLCNTILATRPDILLYSFDKSIPHYDPMAKTILVVHGIAQNDFAAYHPMSTDAVVCVSRHAASLAPSYGIPRDKIFVIPNGVPEPLGMSMRDCWKIPEDAWVWCFVGGLTRLKRPQMLIAALARRRKDWDDEYVIFAGQEDTEMMLQDYASALGVADRCRFLGHVDMVGEVYNSSNCLVVTSERESMPLTIMEAMSCGLPVVANSVGGIPEVLTPEFATMFCDESGEAGLDDALTRIREKCSARPVPAYAYGTWWNAFTLEDMTQAYHSLFQQLLGE